MNSQCYILGLEILKATLCFSIWLHAHCMGSSIFIMHKIIKRQKGKYVTGKCWKGELEKIEYIFSYCKYPDKRRI